MDAFTKELKLISLVNNNYEHIGELETLANHYKLMIESNYSKNYPNEYNLTQAQIDKLVIITKTTQNSHYDMGLYTSKEFQDPSNVIDDVIEIPSTNYKQKYLDLYTKNN